MRVVFELRRLRVLFSRLSPTGCGLLLVAVALLAFSPRLLGQGGTGAINGTVADPTGAVIPGAKVVLTNVATGVARSVLTNETGNYVIPGVIPGDYTLEVTAAGFAAARESSFTLMVNQTATHNFALTVGAQVQEITVTGAVTQIQGSTAELGTAIMSTEVNSLPLNGRNFTQLLALTPGVSPISTAQNAGGGGGWAGNQIGTFTFPSVNGQCNRCNFFVLDGLNNQNAFISTFGTTPIIDAMQEFKVQSHNDSSQFGGALGGIVNVVTKSGTNEYHGDVWEFLRNSALDARNTFIYNKKDSSGNEIPGTAVTPYKQNQFGGVIGGPLVPGHFRKGAAKTWFYAAYEGFRSVKARQYLGLRPTADQLAGDLSTLPGQIYNPWSTREDPAKPGTYLRDPFMCDTNGNPLAVGADKLQAAGTPCNKIPTSLIDPKLVNYYSYDAPPIVNTGVSGTNYINSDPNRMRQDTASLRFDRQFTERTTAWLRYTGFTQPDSSAGGWPGSTSNTYFHGYQAAVALTHTFGGGSKVITASFGRNSVRNNYVAKLGVPDDLWSQTGFVPLFASGYKASGSLNPSACFSGFDCRPSGQRQITDMADIYEWKVDFTLVRGRHTLQAGVDLNTNSTNSPIEYDNVSFGAYQTSNPATGLGGLGIASFLLGVPDSANRRNVFETTYGGRVYGFYAQDSWKATDKLTMNFGLRYDVSLWPIYGSEENGNQFVGNMDLDNGVYILARVPGKCDEANGVGAPCIPTADGSLPEHVIPTPHKNHAIYNNTYDNWGPRVGFAYKLRPTTVIRAAGGRFFDNWGAVTQLSQNYEGTWPDVGQQIANNLNYPTPAKPLPTISAYDPFNTGAGALPMPAPTPFNQVQWFMDPRTQNAYSLQWNLGVQQSLGANTVLEADYVGSHSLRLNSGGYRNVATTPGPGDPALRRPWPYITPTFYDKSIGKGNYNAFQFKLRKNFSQGLSYVISYTWSKAMNTGCDGYFGAEGCDINQVYNLGADKSVAGFDVPHMLNVSWVYELPFGKGKKFSSGSKPLDYVLGNWAVNGIYMVRSGEPFSAHIYEDIPNTGQTQTRANMVGDPYPGTRTREQYINPSAFTVPDIYTYGTLGRNALRHVGAPNWDLSLFRDFPLGLTEATKLQFRAEFFNAFNQSVIGGCLNDNVKDANFGKATCTRNTERQIQFALKLYF